MALVGALGVGLVVWSFLPAGLWRWILGVVAILLATGVSLVVGLYTPRAAVPAPAELKVTHRTAASLTVTWIRDAAVDTYQIWTNVDGQPTEVPQTAPPYTLTGLQPATCYQIHVQAVGKARATSSVEGCTEPRPTVAPPTGLAATATPHSVDLTWVASTDVTVTGYRVSRSGAPIAEIAATQTTYTDAGVAPQHEYDYVIGALVDGVVRSESDSVHVKTPAESGPAAQPPGPPQSLTQTGATTNSVTVSWQLPVTNGTGGAPTYMVSTDNGPETSTGSQLQATITGLGPATTHQIRVCAVSDSGRSMTCPTIPATTKPLYSFKYPLGPNVGACVHNVVVVGPFPSNSVVRVVVQNNDAYFVQPSGEQASANDWYFPLLQFGDPVPAQNGLDEVVHVVVLTGSTQETQFLAGVNAAGRLAHDLSGYNDVLTAAVHRIDASGCSSS